MTQIDASLKALGTDYVDLYQIHRFDPDGGDRGDAGALHDVVKAGKARYIGASSMYDGSSPSCNTPPTAERLTPFVSMQAQYNLLTARTKREMSPVLPRPGRRRDAVERRWRAAS